MYVLWMREKLLYFNQDCSSCIRVFARITSYKPKDTFNCIINM